MSTTHRVCLFIRSCTFHFVLMLIGALGAIPAHAQDSTPYIVFYKVQDTASLPASWPAYTVNYDSADAACGAIAEAQNIRSSTLKFLDAVGKYFPDFEEWGCNVSIQRNDLEGKPIFPNQDKSAWITISGYCPAGFSASTDVVLKTSNPGGTCNRVQAPVSQQGECPACGNPLQFAAGFKIQREVDYEDALGLLTFYRTYRSHDRGLNHGTNGQRAGLYWTDSLQRGILRVQSVRAGVPTVAYVYRPNGMLLTFAEDGTNWVGEADAKSKLTSARNTNGRITAWTYQDADGTVEYYTASGRLGSIVSPQGRVLTMGYGGTAPQPNDPILDRLPPGPLMTVTDDLGRQLRFEYHAETGLMTKLIDPDNKPYVYAYDNDHKLISVTYPDTTARTYQYNDIEGSSVDFRMLTGIVDENSQRFATFNYARFDAGGFDQWKPVSSEHAGVVEKYTINYKQHLAKTEVTDPAGGLRKYEFQTLFGKVRQKSVEERRADGTFQKSRYGYDARGNVSSVVDFSGNLTCYQYDTRNLEIQHVEGLKNASPLTDAQIATLCDATLAAATLAVPLRKTTTTWHPEWRLPKSIREAGAVTTFAYHGDASVSCAPTGASTALLCAKAVQANDDIDGMAAAPTNIGAARTWSYTYNSLGQVLTVDDSLATPLSDVSYEYYANDPSQGLNRGMLKKVTNAKGQSTTLSGYDAHGNPQTIVGPNGITTTLQYDLRQRMTSRTEGGRTTTYEYDNVGLLQRVNLPNLDYAQYFYDGAHRLYKIQDKQGFKIAFHLDNMGNRRRVYHFDAANDFPPLGQLNLVGTPGYIPSKEAKYEFDVLNRLSQDIGGTLPDNQITQLGYDNTGNLTSIKDALNRVTTNVYDELNRLVMVKDPVNDSDATATKYEYNGQDRLTKVIDPRGLSTTYAYNGHGDLLSQVSPDTGTTTFKYDVVGNMKEKSDARGFTAYYAYDALHRPVTLEYKVTSATVPNPNPVLESVTFTYDDCENGIGHLCGISDKTGSVTWTYDLYGAVTSKTQTHAGGLEYKTNYVYNAAGELRQIFTPAGNIIDITYLNGRPVSVKVNDQVILSDAAYLPFGPVKSWKWGNDTVSAPNVHVRAYDKDYRPIEVTSSQPTVPSTTTPVLSHTLVWDFVSRIAEINDPHSTAASFKYNYDGLDRLTSVTPKTTGATEKFGYTYDGVGNRLTSKVDNASTTIYGYPTTSHRLQNLTGAQTKSYTYDAAGNMTGDGSQIWTYGPDNRPTQVTVGATTTAFSINALGQRVQKGTGTAATQFVYDEQGRLTGEYNGDGTLVQETVWFNDLPVAVVKPKTLGDFGGDGKADILWRHSSGYVYLQPMNGFTPVGGDFIYFEPNTTWRIVAQGDVDGDRRQDIVWWNQSTGQVFIQLIDGLTIKGSGGLVGQSNTNLRIVAAKDLDGDGKSDLVWWDSTTGEVKVQYLDGIAVKSTVTLPTQPSTAWKLVGTGDATGDGKADLLWRNDVTGEVKLQSDLTTTGTTIYTEANLAWTILGMPDLNGDGKADILWKNMSTGSVFGQLLNGTTITSNGVIYTEPNLAWQLVHMADFNGDGKTDLLWRNNTTGEVFEQQMNGLVPVGQVIYSEPDQNWKIVPMQDQTGSGSLSAMASSSNVSKLGQANQRPNPPGFGSIGASLNAMNVNTTAVYYVHTDHLGTPRVITRPSDNKLMWKWDGAEPFGNSLPDENPSGLGTFKYNLRFGSVTYYDEETGTLQNTNRDLDTLNGRYLQSDPIGLDGGISTYAYVEGNPLKYFDIEGLTRGERGNAGGGYVPPTGFPARPDRPITPRPTGEVINYPMQPQPPSPPPRMIPASELCPVPVYRGGPNMQARPADVKVDVPTNTLKTSRGVSLNANPNDPNVVKNGGPYRIESVPEGLKFVRPNPQGNPAKYELAPDRQMTMQEFQKLLNQVRLVK